MRRYCAYARARCNATADCHERCEALEHGDDDHPHDAPGGDERYHTPNYGFYDTIECRSAHAALAYPALPGTVLANVAGAEKQCPLAALDGSAACSNDPSVYASAMCDAYCVFAQTNCGGARAPFGEAWQNCTAWCAAGGDAGATRPGTLADESGDTLGCRMNLPTFSDAECAAVRSGGNPNELAQACYDPWPVAVVLAVKFGASRAEYTNRSRYKCLDVRLRGRQGVSNCIEA